MLKLSFNPLQRYYCRGKTVLQFQQNLVEDTDEIKKEVFVKTIKLIVKTGFNQKRKLLLCFLAQVFPKEKKAKSDQIKLALF